MNILPTNKKLNITKIIHIGDIHIRQNKRKEEYKEVFYKFFESVKSFSKEETIIIITGDIFHTKLDLQPEGIKLSEILLRGCADLFPTILVAGNHDTLLTNKSRLDSLSPIVEAMSHPNLFYPKKSGLYSIGDICINNYSVFDDEDCYIRGKNIPEIYKNTYRHFICLFHGTVDGAISEMGFKMVNKNITSHVFDGHDLALCGDIHLPQTLQEDRLPIIRYCGSLIQQSHGEPLEGHGYTLWNLKDKSYTHVEIPNEYGYFTIKIDKGEIKTDISKIPKKSRLRLSCYETLPTETKSVLRELKNITEFVESPTFTREESETQEKRESTLTINLAQGDLRNKEHQSKLITEYLKNKLNIKQEELIEKIIKINDENNELICLDDIPQNIRWTPVKFEWDNLFSFGEDNVIDFTKTKNVVGLFAANATGKSNIFSAFSWCVFDKCEREFKANNIINNQKMSCRAQLEVDIGGVRYFIERIGKMDKKGSIKVNVKFWRIVNGEEENLTGMERSDTNNAIKSFLGTYEDFLLTTLSVQKSGKYNTSFIDLGDSGRKDLLAQFLGLNIFDKLTDIAKEKLADIVSILKVYKNEDYETEITNTDNALSQGEKRCHEELLKYEKLVQIKQSIQKESIEENCKIVKIEGCSYSSLEDIDIDINKHQTIISHNLTQSKSILEEKTNVNNKILDLNSIIQTIEQNDITKKYSEWQNLLASKNSIDIPLSQKITEAKNLKEKVSKTQGYEYDSNCKFCLKNATSLISEGKKAEEMLLEYKDVISDLLTKQTELNVKLKKLQYVQEEYRRYNTLIKDRSKLQQECLDWERKFTEVNKKIDISQEALKKLSDIYKTFLSNRDAIETNVKIKKNVEELERKLLSAINEENKQNQLCRNLMNKNAVLRSKLEELNQKFKKVKEVEKQYKLYDLYLHCVSRDGIPYDIMTSAIPHVENEVNSILSQIVEFHAKFDTDGKSIIPYIVYDERRWLMSLGSGMEQFILSTSIRVALTNLSNLPRSSFLVIDEGWATLDVEHILNISALFHYLKSNFDFVIIISHLESIRDLVENRMEIKKENSFSKIQYI